MSSASHYLILLICTSLHIIKDSKKKLEIIDSKPFHFTDAENKVQKGCVIFFFIFKPLATLNSTKTTYVIFTNCYHLAKLFVFTSHTHICSLDLLLNTMIFHLYFRIHLLIKILSHKSTILIITLKLFIVIEL